MMQVFLCLVVLFVAYIFAWAMCVVAARADADMEQRLREQEGKNGS